MLRLWCLNVVLVAILPLVTSLAVSHQDLESPNTACDGKGSCEATAGSRSRLDLVIDWKERNCLCDADCARYGDCCLDSPHFVLAEQRRGAASFSCVELRQFGGIYMRTTCPPEWGDTVTRTMCETHNDADPMSAMPVTSHQTGLTYRNVHCALCHGDLMPNSTDFWRPRLECPGLVQSLTPNMTFEEVSRALAYDNTRRTWVLRFPDDSSEIRNYTCNIDPVLPTTSEHVVRRCLTGITRTCALNWTNVDVRDRCEAYTSIVYFQNDGFRNAHCAICNNVPVQNLACIRAQSRVHDYTREFSPKAFAVLFDLSGRSGETVGKARACPRDTQLYDYFFRRCRDVVCSREDQEFSHGRCITLMPEHDSTEDYPEVEIDTGVYYNVTNPEGPINISHIRQEDDAKADHFLSCPKFLLDRKDYDLEDAGGSVYVHAYKRRFRTGQFRVREYDGVLELCADSLGVEYVDKFGPNMGYVTISGLGVSIVFLILHLVAFMLLPELRNLSGKNLASLCVALLLAYLAFIIGQFLQAGTAPCCAIAVVTQYFFLSSFSWMLTMAFDVWRTLRLATSELRVSSGKQWRKFAVYSTWSWAVPLIFVVAAVVTDNAPTGSVMTEFRPGFGRSTCWFSHRFALLIFFALPLALVMLLNIAFFASSAHMIFATTSTTRFTSSSGTQRDFRLYIRLALVMGLTWTVGLIAGYLNVEGLWYTFVALNTLQGLFIFLAFTCTEKVVRAFGDGMGRCWKSRRRRRREDLAGMGGKARPPSFSWSGISSSSTRKSQLGSSSESSSHHKEFPPRVDTLY